MVTKDDFTKVNSDVNGNPRYVIHFLNCINIDEAQFKNDGLNQINNIYAFAVDKMHKFGGRKYKGKDFGGGIVFQSYNLQDLANKINETL